MEKQFQQANLFELSSDDIQVTYSSSGIVGGPLFSYRDGNTNRQFSGEEIQCIETGIGQLFTVILEQIPDLRIVTFTLILPVVNIIPGSAGTYIQVTGIRTTTHTTIAGAILGPQKTYSQVHLNGTAQAVAFEIILLAEREAIRKEAS